MYLTAGKAAEDKATIYLLHDAQKDLWCGYRDERAWRTAIGNARANETASVDFVNRIPKVVQITDANDLDSEGWIVFDRYYLSDAGVALSLQRTTNVFGDDVSRKEVFEARRKGHLELQHVFLRSLQVDSPMARSNATFPQLPMAAKVANFPFGALIERAREVLAQDSVCVPPRQAVQDKLQGR